MASGAPGVLPCFTRFTGSTGAVQGYQTAYQLEASMYVIPNFMCWDESLRDAILGLQWLSPCERPLALDRQLAT